MRPAIRQDAYYASIFQMLRSGKIDIYVNVMPPRAGFERVPHDPRLSRRAFLCHTLHRNLPRLPSGEQIIYNSLQLSHLITTRLKPHPNRMNPSRQWVVEAGKPLLLWPSPADFTISHSSLRVFISNNPNHCLSTLAVVLWPNSSRISIHWVRPVYGWTAAVHIYVDCPRAPVYSLTPRTRLWPPPISFPA